VRSQLLRATAPRCQVPPTFYKAISQDLTRQFESGAFLKDGPPKADKPSAPPNPLSDPAAMEGMMGGMKTQAVMMVPQMAIMGWINFFFQGFVLSECLHVRVFVYHAERHVTVKLPFPLTLGFKSMLQRGVETPDMDVRWVSSLSWYFLNFFGLNGLYRLLLGGDNCELSFLVGILGILTTISCGCVPRHERDAVRQCRRTARSADGLRQAFQGGA
jgi:hypothetical protein